MSGESPNAVLYDLNGNALAVQNATALPASTPAIVVAGSDGTNSRFIVVDASGNQIVVGAGVAGTPSGGVVSIQGVASGTVVPVSGTVTANLGTGVIDTTNSGALGALNATVSIALVGTHGVGMQLSAGTLVGTIVPEISYDAGTSWVASFFDDPSTSNKVSSIVFGANNTATTRTIIVTGGASNARIRVSAYTSGTANCALRASVIIEPSELFSGAAAALAPPAIVQVGGNDGTNLRAFLADASGHPIIVGPGTAGTPTGGVVSVQGVSGGQALPISGTVTANIGTTNGLALDTSVNGILLSQGSTTSGEKGPLIQGAVTTAAPSYTTAQTSPLSLTTAGLLRVDGSAVTQPVSGTVTANQGTANSLANAWSVKITDATNGPAAVKAASTAAVAADPALVVAISPNNPISVSGVADTTGTGTLNALNATAQVVMSGLKGAGMQLLAGTLIGTIVPEISLDGGTSWVPTFFDDPATGNLVSSIVFGSSNTAITRTIIGAGGASHVRVRVSAFTSGTATCNLRASQMDDPATLFGGATGSALPPTVAQIGGSVTTAAPAYVNATVNAVSLNTTGDLRTISKVTDGTNGPAAVKAASVAAVATDPALVVAISPNNLLPVTMGSPGAADIFGQLATSKRIPQVQAQFQTAAPSALIKITTSGGATATQGTGTGVFATGAAATADVTGVTTSTVIYSAHSETYAAMTASFTTPTSAATFQRIGLYNSTDGFSFGYNGTTFGLWTRFNTVDTFVSQASWNIDVLSGAANSKFTSNGSPVALVQTNINLYRIRMGWLGIAPIVFEVLSPDGNFVIVHIVRAPNSQTTPTVTNPNMPITIDVNKASADATNLIVTCGCWVAGSTGPAAVKPANTMAVAADPALVVAISPNNPAIIGGSDNIAIRTAFVDITGRQSVQDTDNRILLEQVVYNQLNYGDLFLDVLSYIKNSLLSSSTSSSIGRTINTGGIVPTYGSNNQPITISLAGLTTGSARASTVVDNTTTLYKDVLLFFTVKTGAASTSAFGFINVFGYGTADGGNTYPEGITGTDGGITLTSPPNVSLVAQINTVANATTYKLGPVSFCTLYGLPSLPQKWGIVVSNQSGGTLDATASNFSVRYQGIN